MLSISQNVRVCVRVFVPPSMCSLFEVPFKRLFAPTSRILMSKSFSDSESLGQSIGKKWSQIWTFLLKNGLKLQQRNKFLLIFVNLFTLKMPFKGLFAPVSQSQMSNIFRDSESLGKSYGKKWSQMWTFVLKNM